MSGDRLADIEDVASGGIHHPLMTISRADVLALVEIARAAERVEAAFAADPHDPNELWNASGPLRRALEGLRDAD